MFGILEWKCIVPGSEIENVKQDRKHSKSAYRPHGCCGIGIPVFKIRVEYGMEKPVVLLIEQEEKVEELLDLVCKSNPGIVIEYYLSPHTGLRPEKISPPLY